MLQKKNVEFTQTLVKTLDKSLNNIDELNLRRLRNVRTQVLSHPIYSSRKWVALGAAASLATLIAMPVLWKQSNVQNFTDSDVELISQEVPLAAQEFDDMDMLIAMDDSGT